MAVTVRYLLRGDTAEAWETKNPILLKNEIAYDMTNRRIKFGDGKTLWKNLPYVKPDVINDLLTGGTDAALSAEQGKILKSLVDSKADSATVTNLEKTIQQITEQIESGGSSVKVDDTLSSDSHENALSAYQGKWLAERVVYRAQVQDNLDSDSGDLPLSAKQGKVLKGMIPEVSNDTSETSITKACSANIGNWIFNNALIWTNIYDNLDCNGETFGSKAKVLSANQGRVLKELITAVNARVDNISSSGSSTTQIQVINNLTSTSTTDALSANQGRVLRSSLNNKADSSALTTLETNLTQKINDNKVTVVNNLTSTSTTYALSANQGKVLNDKVKNYSTESWTFTLSTGSTVTKKVVLSS